MAFGVLFAGPRSSTKNIGDYIQSLAQIQYIGNDYLPIERERISLYNSNNGEDHETKTIMNAWWMWDPDFWPPSQSIIPCMISMHISPLVADKMLSQIGVDYFKKYQPIGCRDMGTQRILQSKGIDCYFSACLTLTLGRTFSINDSSREGLLFCDPYFNPINKSNLKLLFPSIPTILTNLSGILRLSKKTFFRQYLGNGDLAFDGFIKSRLRGFLNAISFFTTYSSKFDKDLLLSAEYITNLVDVRAPITHDALLKIAENHVRQFAKAKLVITSRVHCALPCLGLRTPTIFILHDDMNDKGIKFNTPGRFEGLIDFFRVLQIQGKKFVSEDEVINSMDHIGINSRIANKSGWEKYEEKLNSTCIEFVTS